MPLLWDVRTALEQNEAKMLEGIIQKNSNKQSYYIFKHSHWTGNGKDTLKSTYMLRSTKPPKMLGTVLWLVDNTKGTLEKVWELPLDIDYVGVDLQDGTSQQVVHDSMGDVAPAILLS